jgi:hypothetical protein
MKLEDFRLVEEDGAICLEVKNKTKGCWYYLLTIHPQGSLSVHRFVESDMGLDLHKNGMIKINDLP